MFALLEKVEISLLIYITFKKVINFICLTFMGKSIMQCNCLFVYQIVTG